MIVFKNDLTPKLYNLLSFYNKARIIKEDGIIKLASYDVIVAKIGLNREIWITNDPGDLTLTTCKHIREFLYQYGRFSEQKAKSLTKADIIALSGRSDKIKVEEY